MHMSETLPENKTGRLRSVRGVHLPTVPRESRFHTTPVLNTYTVQAP
jgi:hypothetical protein